MDKMDRPDDEWRKLLTPEQYKVLRKEGTERAGTSPLNQEKRKGRARRRQHKANRLGS